MNKRKKSKTRWISYAVFAALFAYAAYILFNQELILRRQKDQLKTVNSKVEEQNKINEDLKKQKEIINTDEYAEKVARDKLGMVKDGEKIFIDVNR